MTEADIVTVAPVIISTLLGGWLLLSSYSIHDGLVALIGLVTGGSIGGIAGWVVFPDANPGVEIELQIAVTAITMLVGMIVGVYLLRLFTRLATVVVGFAAGTTATLLVLAGESSGMELGTIDPLAVVDTLMGLQSQPTTLLIVGVIGLVSAIVALRFYAVIMTVLISALGAGLLTFAIPHWIELFGYDASAIPVATPLVFVGVLAVGLAVQYSHYNFNTATPA